ncbi:MAG: tagaturonate epimerase family protein [Ignavibacteriales bacterium]|nr:tagaturonate epimerase family protein [Ignavibacteriales bacterium]
MTQDQLYKALAEGNGVSERTTTITVSPGRSLQVYRASVSMQQKTIFCIAREGAAKNLWILSFDGNQTLLNGFDGEVIDLFPGVSIKRCQMIHGNAEALRSIFPYTRPVLVGLRNSLGCGDRLGIANAGHIRAMAGSGFIPVLAQQSVRELERTRREAVDVMDAATWAVFQEGYKGGFGADGDHLKTPEDIDRYAKAGFTMFTLDIGAYVVNEAARLPIDDVKQRVAALPFDLLRDTLKDLVARYANQEFILAADFILKPKEEDVLRTAVKYGAAIGQTVTLNNHLRAHYDPASYEIELSVDETDTPTSPLEHFIIANELRRLGVSIISLAPRFIGDFEKGIEYKGDLEAFKQEYIKHQYIARHLGPYKISIHSGSDKFDIYKVIGKMGAKNVHVKTAGTSWLEALRAIASVDPALFREILNFACTRYATDRQSYHVTGEVSRLKPAEQYSDQQLKELLEDVNARQILHVTFGNILSSKDAAGNDVFKQRIMACLNENEDAHYECLIKHFNRHLSPLLGKT